VREGGQRLLDGLDVNQAAVDRQRLVGVLAIEAETGLAAPAKHMEFSPKAVAPWIVHTVDLDPLERKLEPDARQLVMEDSPLLGQLLCIGHMLQLAAAASELEERAWWIDPSPGWIDDGGRLRTPEILSPVDDLGFHGLPWDGALDEDDATVDASHCRPTVGELANRDPH
jgi:hypothetical protein